MMPPEDAVPLTVLLDHLKWHLQRMAEMQKNEPTVYYRDAALQRYEFTLGSAIKCIRAAARERQQSCDTEETALGMAVKEGWLPPETDWADLLASYRQMQPATRKDHADAVYAKLPDYQQRFRHLYEALSSLARTQAG